MSAIVDDGGPAFPSEAVIRTAFGELNSAKGTRFAIEGGMTLRDYFAGQALAGMLAHPDSWDGYSYPERACYKIADVMIEERNKKKEASE